MVFGFLRKRSAEVGVLLERIELAQQAVPEDLQALSAPLFAELTGVVRSKWKQEHIDNYVAEIRRGETHEAFLYNFLVHATANRLESGHFHIYRGVLSGEGVQYKRLFEHAIETMIARGGYTKEWADENLRRQVYQEIKEMG